MGMFSWIYSDSKKAMKADKKKNSYLLIPDAFGGGYHKEECYEGYGRIGDVDVYEEVAKWNLSEEELAPYGDFSNKDSYGDIIPMNPEEDSTPLRTLGINIACYDEQNAKLKYPIKIVSDKRGKNYDDVAPSESDPNQGW